METVSLSSALIGVVMIAIVVIAGLIRVHHLEKKVSKSK